MNDDLSIPGISTPESRLELEPSSAMIVLTYIIYGLHLFSAVTGILTPAFVLTAFLTGWPSIIAVILNYAKRSDARGTFLESHFRWQIRTFWYACLWLLISTLVALTFFGLPVAFLMVCFTGMWVLYRIVRGLLCMLDGRSIQPGV
jgi:uncharacterized membrane protein